MVLFGSFSSHIRTQHSESTFSPREEHFNCNDPNSFLFCTCISVRGFQLPEWFHCVDQRSARCRRNGKESLHRDCTRTRGEGQICPPAASLSSVWQSPCADAGPGDGQKGRPGSRTHTHTHTTVPGVPPAAATVGRWWRQAGSASRPCGQRPVVGYSSW